ncbi:putative reverse transcriptase domain-containing protein [Tanacetum coccineum]
MSSEALAELYLREPVAIHRVQVSIVSDRDTRFTSRFWQKFQKDLCTRVHFSIAYHPQTDCKSERTIQTLKDMLRACVIEFDGSWDKYLPLAEFSYTNTYHSSIKMPPYEMLYGRKCGTPIYETAHVPLADIVVDEKLSYVEEPVEILDTKVKKLKNKERLKENGHVVIVLAEGSESNLRIEEKKTHLEEMTITRDEDVGNLQKLPQWLQNAKAQSGESESEP